MLDAHCHLQEFSEAEIQSITSTPGMAGIICCGAGVESSRKAVEIAGKHNNVYATVGIHPEEMAGFDPERDLSTLLETTKRPRVVAIGECGLDYGAHLEGGREEQRALFRFNIELAKKTGLPLVVHCRNAFDDVFTLLDYDRVQMHCFTGNQAQMEECVRRGWYISLGGILTFKSSHQLREVAKMVPEDQLLVETDAPWLAPEPIRGSRNTPVNVKIVLDRLADICGRDMTEITVQNAKRLFNL